ncbi:MAG: T9SS type A sorting domain-containing protein [Chitinophagaceae bacterium]
MKPTGFNLILSRSSLIGLLLLLKSVGAFAQPVNNLCTAPTALNQGSSSCTNVAGTLVAATYTAFTGACGASSGNRNDVWYSFVAKTSNPTITISGALASNQPSLQIVQNNCPTLTSVQCVTSSASITGSGLTVGTTYLVRVFSNNNTASTFNICISDPAPANDLCTNAVTLTSSTTCTTTSGNVYAATVSGTTISAPDCVVGSVTYDVWYKFVAQTADPTITLSNIGAGFTNYGIQLLSNNCGGTFTPYFCTTSSTLATDYLTPGTTYFIRIYSTGTAPTTSANAGFDICVTDDVSVAFNDECTNAINLPIWNSCNNVAGTMAGATASTTTPLPSCNTPLTYDVWYKFTSINTTATITLSSLGANFTGAALQVLSGTCGSLSQVGCGTSPLSVSGLTAGTVYYVRVFSKNTPLPNGNAGFNICVTTTNAPVRYGNSYVNITRKTTGGQVRNGDVLEIRMTINHTSGTYSKLRFVDNIPSKTTIATGGGNDSIRVITNEGLIYKKYSRAAGDDAATYVASPPSGEYNIRLNLGFGGTNPGIPVNNTLTESVSCTGTMNGGSDKPKGGGGMLFAVAYRVVVTGASGDTILLNAPQFTYNNGSGDVTLTGTAYKIIISDSLALCSNSNSVNNAVEYGGTFGSGTTTNRSTDLSSPISGYTFVPNYDYNNGVGDGRYAIVKNLSPKSSTTIGARRIPNCGSGLAFNDPLNCNNRTYSHWYISGDHSGTSNSTGNAPPASSASSGYMLLVNADYVASEIYRQQINNLCPNTYYEFSAWVKNICATCGIDSVGNQFTGSPTAPANGYPGVYPNLSFSLNGIDYYSTGEIDTLGWLKRGFTFKTDSNQTSAIFSIRNNAQGGGGNDWALDDISVATCYPNMSYSPSTSPNVCENNPITITDTVRSLFNNYVKYKWQRSTDGGFTWNDIAGATGTTSPVLVGGQYQSVLSYTIPSSQTTAANSGDRYRLIIASTTTNLSNSCGYSDPTAIILNVLTNCGPPLATDLLSVSGSLLGDYARISWVTSKEEGNVKYYVQRSNDGVTFTTIGTVNGFNNINTEKNYYDFDDPRPITGKAYYRIAVADATTIKKYSRIITLSLGPISNWTLGQVITPFNNVLQYEITTPAAGIATVTLIDNFGKQVKTIHQQVNKGVNALALDNTGGLPSGIYMLKVSLNEAMQTRKVMKLIL